MEEIKVFSGRNSSVLSQSISAYLGMKLSNCVYKTFTDGELWIKYNENLRGCQVFIIQSINSPAENLMELLIMIDTAKRASASNIIAVIPYLGYSRQDRKDQSRVPITARLVANLLERAGADGIITMDLHTPQIQGFYDINVDQIYGSSLFHSVIRELHIDNLAVVSPDLGRLKIARTYSKILSAELIIIDKNHTANDKVEILNIIGNVKDKNVVIVDDIIDTGGTFANSVYALKENGANDIYGVCTHAVLSGNAISLIENLPIKKLYVTDTINIKEISDKIEIISAANIFAEAIKRTSNQRSITTLFDV